MDYKDLETEVLKLAPLDRAKLVGKLLNSLERLSKQEVSQLWAEEARCRDAEMDADPKSEIPAEDVFREAGSNSRRPANSALGGWPSKT